MSAGGRIFNDQADILITTTEAWKVVCDACPTMLARFWTQRAATTFALAHRRDFHGSTEPSPSAASPEGDGGKKAQP